MTKCIKCDNKEYESGFCKLHFQNYMENKVRKTIRKFKLINKAKHKVGIAVSGGKDSSTLLFILKKLGYKIEAITVNANIGNYSKQNLKNLEEFCEKLNIKLHTISFREEYGFALCYIRDVLKQKGYDYQSCVICGVLRRKIINKYSKKLGFDLLATGHNMDDEAQSILMNIFRNDTKRIYRGGPISGITRDKKFVTRIKPLYQISESEITKYSKLKKFPVKYERCPCSTEAFRMEFRNILEPYTKKHP
ncbi:MAG: ATP-binding protein, partial [Nanoarchaeota archaeon]